MNARCERCGDPVRCYSCEEEGIVDEPAPRSVDVAALRACLESIAESAADSDNIQAIKDEARHGLRILDTERRKPPGPHDPSWIPPGFLRPKPGAASEAFPDHVYRDDAWVTIEEAQRIYDAEHGYGPTPNRSHLPDETRDLVEEVLHGFDKWDGHSKSSRAAIKLRALLACDLAPVGGGS